MTAPVVAIDGPSGSGKSTVAAALAARLGVVHVDTGAYYRAATLAVLRAGVDPADEAGVLAVVTAVSVRRRAGRTLLGGADVEDEIRTARVSAAVSVVSRHPEVRRVLRALQRAAVGVGGAVVEGRDAATAVVPDAPLKVWLDAAVEARAARRAAQLGEAGPQAVSAHAAALAERDAADATQMARAPGVVVLDTTGLDVEQVLGRLEALAAAVAPNGH